MDVLLTPPAQAPSAWVQRFAALLRPRATVLDVACGSGRHVRWLAAHGFAVTGVDRDAAVLDPLRSVAEVVPADLETAPWPLPGRRFDGIVITNYLWRPLWPALRAALADGGVVIHETFADGQQHIGKPSRADFLLQPGELLRVWHGLRIVAFEDGFEPQPPRCVQRIAAVNAVNAMDAVNAVDAASAVSTGDAFSAASAGAAQDVVPPPRYSLAGHGG